MNEIFNRRSTRHYSDEKIEYADLVKLCNAGMHAPTAMNKRSWQFLIVDDAELIKKLSTVSPYSKCIENAKGIIIVFYDTNTEILKDYIQQDLSAATQNILTMATHIKLGSLWVGVYPETTIMNNIKNIFNMPDNIVPFSIVSLGYPLKKRTIIDRFDESKIHHNSLK